MIDIFNGSVPETKSVPPEQTVLRRKYSKPILEELGDLRSITLGGSVAPDYDSGGGSWVDVYPDLP